MYIWDLYLPCIVPTGQLLSTIYSIGSDKLSQSVILRECDQVVSSPYLQIVHLKKVFRSVNLLFLFFVVFFVVVVVFPIVPCPYCVFCVVIYVCVYCRAILILVMLVDGPGVEHQIIYKEKSSTY